MKNVILALGLLASSSAMADACFYSDAQLSGNQMCLRDGDAMQNLDRTGFNDQISSLRLDRGSSVRVCSDAYFQGECRIFNRDEYNFDWIGFNDRVSSIEVLGFRRPPPPPPPRRDEVCVYEHANFGGRSMCFGARDGIDNLQDVGFNDAVSSIRINRPDLTVTVCTDAYFQGRCMTLGRDEYNFSSLGMNDSISSIRIDTRWR